MGVREVPFCFHFKNLFLFDEMNDQKTQVKPKVQLVGGPACGMRLDWPANELRVTVDDSVYERETETNALFMVPAHWRDLR
jgi:hypothetical protein